MLIALETIELENLNLDVDGDLVLIIDPRDKKLKDLYINQKQIWLKGFRAAETDTNEKREARICEKICELINGTISVDTYADKDYVCGLIKQIFKDGGN